MVVVPHTFRHSFGTHPRFGKVLLACGVASSVLYVVVDIIASMRYEGYRYTEQQVSELLAEGAPSRPLMIALMVISYDLLVVAFAAGIWATSGKRRAGRVTAILLTAYALSGAAGGGLFNMDRREVIAAGDATLRNDLHVPATILMSLFVMGAMIAGSRLLDRHFRWYTYGTLATLIICGVLVSSQVDQLVKDKPTPWMGIEERVNIYALMLWIVILAAGLARTQGDAIPRWIDGPDAPTRRQPQLPG